MAAALGVAALGLQTTSASAAPADRGTPMILRGSPEMLYSVQALRGHRPYMEDTNHVANNGCFAAVYDGHGGAFVSRYLKANLYPQVCASLEAQEAAGDDASGLALGVSDGSGVDGAMPTVSTARLKRALTEAFRRVDSDVEAVQQWRNQGSTATVAVVLRDEKGARGGDPKRGRGNNGLRGSDGAQDDQDLPESPAPALSGAGTGYIVTANVGDSRVVLSRRGQAVDLTRDHKPNCPSELARIQALGGNVHWHGFYHADGRPMDGTGVYRVNGNLAVSRAVGDSTEKPFISGEPDVRGVPLDSDGDQFLIVASDGLWDVMTSDEAVGYVHAVMADSVGALREGASDSSHVTGPLERRAQRRIEDWTLTHKSDRGMIRAAMESRKRHMARYLTEEAMRRGTTDNVTIIVLWLQ